MSPVHRPGGTLRGLAWAPLERGGEALRACWHGNAAGLGRCGGTTLRVAGVMRRSLARPWRRSQAEKSGMTRAKGLLIKG